MSSYSLPLLKSVSEASEDPALSYQSLHCLHEQKKNEFNLGFSNLSEVGARGLLRLGKKHLGYQIWEFRFRLENQLFEVFLRVAVLHRFYLFPDLLS